MTHECKNCGTTVSASYARVFSASGDGDVECCPYCEDRIRSNGQVREARSSRRVDQREGAGA